jgi:DNA repair protein RadC
MVAMTDAPYHVLIKEMPESERPRERLEAYGAAVLSDAELIAIALGTGSRNENAISLAHRVLNRFRSLAGLDNAGFSELCSIPGIGPAKAAHLKAALEIGRRAILSANGHRPTITCPADAAQVFMAEMSMLRQEQLQVMLLDTKHHVLRTHTVYVGSVNAAMVRVAEVFREAIKENATAILIAHNHPSGDPTPSMDDVRVTQEIVRAGKNLDIEVLDHLIVGGQQYISLKERGLGFD